MITNRKKCKSGRTISLILLVVLMCDAEIFWAQTPEADEGFARYLFENGEYYRAITEYLRLLYHSEDTTQNLLFRRQIALCYYFGADYEEFITYLDRNRNFFRREPTLRAELELYLGKAYYHRHQYYQAIQALEWSNIDPENPRYSEMQFMLGISYARIFEWQAAGKCMRLVNPSSPRGKIADDFCRMLQTASILPTRHPWVAGTFSALIPGAGYLYSHRPGTALTSLIINGLFIWTVRDAIHHRQYGLASAATFLGIGWYLGNIKGSADAASNYNAHVRNQFIDQFLNRVDIEHIPENVLSTPR